MDVVVAQTEVGHVVEGQSDGFLLGGERRDEVVEVVGLGRDDLQLVGGVHGEQHFKVEQVVLDVDAGIDHVVRVAVILGFQQQQVALEDGPHLVADLSLPQLLAAGAQHFELVFQ